METVADEKFVEKLTYIYQNIGYFYVIRRNTWPKNHYKFGITSNYPKRMANYNNMDLIPIECCHLLICDNAKNLEKMIKDKVKELKVCVKSNEWVNIDLNELLKIVYSFIELDKEKKMHTGADIYCLKINKIPVKNVNKIVEPDIIKRLKVNGLSFILPVTRIYDVKPANVRLDALPI